MILDATAAELAFYAARVGLGGETLLSKHVAPASEIIAAMKAATKPVRITGETRDSILRFALSPIKNDPEAERRFRIRLHNLGSAQPPLVEEDAPDSAIVLVIAFDHLLRVSKGSWLEFIRDYWIDGPLSMAADRPNSEWSAGFEIPAAVLADVHAVILVGYQHGNQFDAPFNSKGWEAA